MVYGNLHQSIKAVGSSQNTHAWTMFVTLNNHKEMTEKLIKSVEYTLHPTFNPPVVKVDKYPFGLRRIGWGTFEVRIKIEWQHWTGFALKKLKHEISFSPEGASTRIVEKIPAILNQQNLAASQGKKFGRSVCDLGSF